MPKRVIDFDAMWGSDKLASCADWAQSEYAWLYGLADASGCFEITNLRVIWGRVAAIRGNLSIERLEQIFLEFQDKGLLFVWEHEGKRYAHWTGSDMPGRLPPPSWRMRLERFAPPVPKQKLAEYMSKFARGRAALAGAGFHGSEQPEGLYRQEDLKFECPQLNGKSAGAVAGQGALKVHLEATQAQDLDWNRNGGGERDLKLTALGEVRAGSEGTIRRSEGSQTDFLNSNSPSKASFPSQASSDLPSRASAQSPSGGEVIARGMSAKDLAVARELRVGQGPVCGPASVRPEVLERVRLRDLALAARRSR
jgi:hypothetical protein